MATIKVLRWIDGRKCDLAATFHDLDDAKACVAENNGQPGGHVYGIDPADLPQSYYACSQYESEDGGSGFEWSLDGEYGTEADAVAKSVDTANSAMLDSGNKIEVFVYLAEAGLTETNFADARQTQIAYGKFSKSQQGEIRESDLQRK